MKQLPLKFVISKVASNSSDDGRVQFTVIESFFCKPANEWLQGIPVSVKIIDRLTGNEGGQDKSPG